MTADLGRRDHRRHRVARAGRGRQLRRRRPRRRSSRGGAGRRRAARRAPTSSCRGGAWSAPTGGSSPPSRRARRRYCAPRASSSAAGESSPLPSVASPDGRRPAVADLTLTKAMRMFARASRNVGASGPSRSPSPSTRLPTASIASDGARQVRWRRRQVDRRQLVEAHHVVGDDDLGGHLGEPPAGVLDRLLGVAEHASSIVGAVALARGARRSHRRSARSRRAWNPPAPELPYGAISKRSGGDPHPATTTVRASGSYGTAGRCAQISSAGFASS